MELSIATPCLDRAVLLSDYAFYVEVPVGA